MPNTINKIEGKRGILVLVLQEHDIVTGYSSLNWYKIIPLMLLFCLFFCMTSCCAIVFCPDDRYLMPLNNSFPWGAIGYMDNGCTATLIDSRHIVAAAHCFCLDDNGSWQPPDPKNKSLYFYPNFNPRRPNSPSVSIDRAVVGTRVQTGGEFQASDWGIGHLAKEVTGYQPMQVDFPLSANLDVMSSGYGRDLFFFGVGQAPPGGESKMGCNVWWQPALVDPKCKIYRIDQDQLLFDCATVGGNSGSPIIYRFNDKYYLVGVIHGSPPGYSLWHGWWNVAGAQVDVGSPVSVASRGANNLDVFVVGKDGGIHSAAWGSQTNYTWMGWWRILNLEAKPGSIVAAVSRSADWLDIFAVGKDGGIYTASWNPAFKDGWHGWWKITGLQVDPGTPLSVASKGANRLDVFVVGKDGGVYTASWDSQTNVWSSFAQIPNLKAKPGSIITAIARNSNRLDIFVTGKDGNVYTSSLAPPKKDWQSWSTISGIKVKPGTPVSAASRGPDNLDIFVVGRDGGIYVAAKGLQTNNVWQNWSRISDQIVDEKSYIAAVSRGADKLDIFVAAKDGKVYTAGWEPKFSCGWKGWQNVLDLSFKSGSYIGATSRSMDWLDIFAASVDSGIYTASWNPGFTCEACSDQGPTIDRLNAGPSAKRFKYAPKYAQNVALARYIDGSARTQIFVTDPDSNRVVTRSRNGNSVDDGFSTYDTFGYIIAPRQIAAFLQTNNKPQVVVTCDDGRLYTRAVAKSSNRWNYWMTIDLPARVTKVLDVDAAYDCEGTNQIYIIGDDGNLYTRGRVDKEPDSAWKAWEKLTTSGFYRKVTALRRSDGTQQVFMVDSTGGLATLRQLQAKPTSSWTTDYGLAAPSTVGIVDIDAAWTEDEKVQIFAVDKKGALWINAPFKGWGAWQSWDTNLYAPAATTPQPPPEGIVSLTASRWQENAEEDIVPVVFATDNRGNIYFTTHKRSEGWSAWRSFYH